MDLVVFDRRVEVRKAFIPAVVGVNVQIRMDFVDVFRHNIKGEVSVSYFLVRDVCILKKVMARISFLSTERLGRLFATMVIVGKVLDPSVGIAILFVPKAVLGGVSILKERIERLFRATDEAVRNASVVLDSKERFVEAIHIAFILSQAVIEAI